MEFEIEKKEAFTLIGVERHFQVESGKEDVPDFWEEVMLRPSAPVGMFGVCREADELGFDYIIADLYSPWVEIPEGWSVFHCPACTWAVFPVTGPLPESLQETKERVWETWLPENGQWKRAGDFSLEFYADFDEEDGEEYSEIWIPVVPAQ